jgi:AhpD family alkylhydroperoxidase
LRYHEGFVIPWQDDYERRTQGSEKMQNQESSHDTMEDHIIHYKKGLAKYEEHMPEVVQTYHEFTEHCFREGEISLKNKQLIALGIGVYSQDEYCIIYHTKGCLEQGCSEKEIYEAIGISAALGGGAAMSQGVTLVQDCINERKEKNTH